MNPQQTQSQPTGQLLNTQPAPMMPPDQAAASLAFATHLQGQMIPKQDPSQPSPNAPQQEQPQAAPQSAPFDPEAFKQEVDKSVQDTIKKEMSSFKEELMSVLKEDDGQEQ